MTTPRRVSTPDGISLAVYETGDSSRPTVVAIHGYPDNHAVWDGVVAELADRFHVVTYDVRGTGASDKPGPRSAYRMTHLVDDLAAVLDAVSPAAPVHLLAHDWGSIQSWPAIVDDRLAGRVASFTSISGPSLDYSAAWLRQLHKHPVASARQLAHSYYIAAFQLPGLPEFAARRGVLDKLIALGSARTRSAAARRTEPSRTEADKVNGISLYRANMAGSLGRPQPVPTRVPVQVIVPDADAYVTPELAAGAPHGWVENMSVTHVAGGHWIVSERPDVIARLLRDFVDSSGGESIEAATTTARHGEFAGRLAVVTGGARGIGRATALELAAHGADVVIADIDDVAAKATVDELRELGVQARAAHLDVSDTANWESFAAMVRDEHGVPDIVVNNAGIGMGGPFLGTSVDDWSKIIGVNVWSVIHGCRLFAAQQVERGQGGHIANVASAAAYSPSIVYPAYATSKAAVLMLTECLRAELEREGIGVTAVCPGFIDTDISKTTIHVGVDEDEAKRLSEHQVASYARRGYGPEKVAKQLVRAVAANKPIAIITPEAKFFRTVSRVSPRLGRRIAKLDLNKILMSTDRHLGRDIDRDIDRVALHARDVAFDWTGTPLRWIPGETFASHMLNVLHLLLPEGERWFVRVFSEALPLIKDDQLREDVLGFIGQEGMHAGAHQAVQDYFTEQGLDTEKYVHELETLFRVLLGPRKLTGRRGEEWLIERVALVAAVEHVTAFLGNWILNSPGLDAAGADEQMLDLLRWHGAEEVEHRAVAYDVYMHVDGRYLRRARTYAVGATALCYLWARGVGALVANDPTLLAPTRPKWRDLVRSARKGLTPGYLDIVNCAWRYLQPGYHPRREGSTSQAVEYLAQSPAARAADARASA